MKFINIFKYSIVLITMPIIICSCANYKNIPYFQNAAEYNENKGGELYDITIKPKDLLTILVFSGTDKEAVSIFNLVDPVLNKKNMASGSRAIHEYLVDKDGYINFPVVGKIHVGNLTIEKANQHIKDLIMPYLKPGTDCVVNTYLANFQITVMGEVQSPNTFTITRPKISVIEALALAGDMTIYGKRENVKVLRELTDGTYEVHELDMRDANILNSPYYYLQQRDVVYVEPNKVAAQNAKIGKTTQLWLRGLSITISLGSVLYMVLK